jgi:hypothetical protein
MSLVLDDEGPGSPPREAPFKREAASVMREWIASTSPDSAVALMRQRGLPLPDPFDPYLLRGGLSYDVATATAAITLRFCGEEGEPFAVNFLDAWLKVADERDVRKRSEAYTTTIANLNAEEEKLHSELEKAELQVSSKQLEADKTGDPSDERRFRSAAADYERSEKQMNLLMEKEAELLVLKASVMPRVRVLRPAGPCK